MAGVQVPLTQKGAALFESRLEVIERVPLFVCSRYQLSSADGEDFSSDVKLKLIEADYGIVRKV